MIAHYLIHYADGQQANCPVIYGEDIRDLLTTSDPAPTASRAVIVWLRQSIIQLYCRTYQNPPPEMEVADIDFIPRDVPCEPFLVALTTDP